jgi:peptidyl-prolyl cis-trans isomerase A (cyclophilin A)
LEEISLIRTAWIATCAAMLALLASVPSAAAVMQGSKRHPVATIETSMGNLKCVLFPRSAPLGTANFIGLARGTKDWTDPRTGKKMHGVPLYDNTTFHRVIPRFMIQGGDPLGNGMGTPGFKFKNETWPSLRFDQPGRLAYANAGPDTNGSQFFITEVPTPFLNGKYTIFGQCDAASVRLVKKIARVPRNSADRPETPVVITHIEIDDGSHSHAARHHARHKGRR